MPSDRTLTRFAQPPNIKPDRVARSLHTLVSAALNRATRNTNTTITTLATNKTTPIDTLLNHATNEISTLANRTTTAIQQYQATNHTNTAQRR